MLHTVLASLALGIAGFDPLGIVALVAAMALGVRRRGIVVLLLGVLVTTFLCGIIPALTLGPAVWKVSHAMRHVSHSVWGTVTLLAGIALIVWGAVRLVHPPRPGIDEEMAPRSTSATGMALSGVLVGLSAFIDPAFYGVVVLAARQSNPGTSALMIASWILASHSALIVVGLAALLGLYAPVHRAIEYVRTRWRRPLTLAASLALLVVGVFCIVEGVAEWHHHWLLPSSVRPHRHR